MAATKNKTRQYANVMLNMDTKRKLEKVCEFRGWKKTVAVERMTDRELEAIEREQAAATVAGGQ